MIILAIIVMSCGGPVDKFEPNNEITEAVEVELGEPFTITIKPMHDRDWFKVPVFGQGYLKIQVNKVPEALELEAAFALYKKLDRSKEQWLTDWKKLPNALYVPKADTYYFVIKDNYDDKSSEEPIFVKMDFIEELDATEPNNNVDEAYEVELGSTVKPAIYPGRDFDWFKVKVLERGYLSVSCKSVPNQIDLEVYFAVYNEWADPKVKKLTDWKKLPSACFVPDSGEYIIVLHDDNDDKFSERSFDMKVEFIEDMDPSEPNDDFRDASSVKLGDTIKLAIFPTGDNDYYKIKLHKGDVIKVEMNGQTGGIVPEARLYTVNDEEPNKLKAFTHWNKLPAEFSIDVGGEVYIHIHDDYDDKSSPEPFEVTVK
ncbi:hypothetical protein JXI42_10130 [bacterium]|nr:hypothetical protein [bacterium]